MRLSGGIGGVARDCDVRAGGAEERKLHGPAAHFAGARARHYQGGRPAMSCARMMKVLAYAAILLGCIAPVGVARAAQAAQVNDQTLHAMRDEMARSKARLELNIPGTQQPVRPYYVEYRLLDLDSRAIVAAFATPLTPPPSPTPS